MGLRDSLFTFAIGLVVGAAGIHIGALLVLGESAVQLAFFTALGGAVVWTIARHFFGWVPLLGIVLTFIIWLGFVNGQYSGGLREAAKIAGIAWVLSIGADFILHLMGLKKVHAIGVPEA